MQLIVGLLCQLLAVACVVGSAGWLAQFSLSLGWIVCIQAATAAFISGILRQPPWWRPIHLVFMPAAWFLLSYQLSAWLYLSAFILLFLLFWGTIKGEVPLFLSSTAVSDALIVIVNEEQSETLIELGAGIGSVVVPLARRLPKLRITALENAPLPWLILRWRCRHLDNVCVLRQNLWRCHLRDFKLAYAFLSPKVMSRIAEKCLQEMPEGSLLVSSSFTVPNWQPQTLRQLTDRRCTKLYCYRLPMSSSLLSSSFEKVA